MEGIRTIKLGGQSEGSDRLTFVSAELLPLKYGYVPLVLVRYSVNDNLQEFGLRLDLDERVFLDSLDDPEMQDVLEKSAAELSDFIQERFVSAS